MHRDERLAQVNIERLSRLDLTEVWKHEAHDFTPWLKENIDLINECLPVGIQPDSLVKEKGAGDFSADLVAEDANGHVVVIENQLYKSDHKHLGQILTYVSELEARTAIWIVSEPRPEHIAAVTWLNNSKLAKFYLCKLEVVRIGNSAAAPVLTKIVGPAESDEELAEFRDAQKNRDETRRSFYTRVLHEASESFKMFEGKTPSNGPYMGVAAGQRGFFYNFGVRMHETSAILWIERGADWKDWNKNAFKFFVERKEVIENEIGGTIEWDDKEDNRSCKIIVRLTDGGWMDEDKWDVVVPKTVALMEKLYKTTKTMIAPAAASADELLRLNTPIEDVGNE